MSGFKNPYDPNIKLSSGCACGRHATPAEHDAALDADALASGPLGGNTVGGRHQKLICNEMNYF